MGEHSAHDHVGHGEKACDERDRQQQREIERTVLRSCRRRVVVGDQVLRHLRQQHGADRDADHADRQLIEAIGVVQRRQRAGRQECRDDGVGEQRELGAHRAERRRSQRTEEFPDILVELKRRKARQAAVTR